MQGAASRCATPSSPMPRSQPSASSCSSSAPACARVRAAFISPSLQAARTSTSSRQPISPSSGLSAPPEAASHSANRARTNARVHPLHFHDNASLRDSLCKNHGLVLSPQPSQQAQNRLRPLGSPAIVRQNHRGYEKSGLNTSEHVQ